MATFTGPPGSGEARSPQPRALIVTIYGLYARETDGWLSVASLIRLMAELGADEPAIRSSISRLKRRGILDARRVNGAAGYGLSESGRQTLAEGDRRIFERPRARPSDGWLLAVFSVPESQRQQRHALRSRLAWLGFGTVSAGVWIAPGNLAHETTGVLQRCGLVGYVTLFRAEYLAFGDMADRVGQWWDLDRLQRMYLDFRQAHEPLLARWPDPGSPPAPGSSPGPGESNGAGDGSDGEAFAAYVTALTDWRRLPYLDPGLPEELLPPQWHGCRAADLFGALQARLAGPARRYALTVTGEQPPVA
ncbi:MAG TPA: PaaX family transcriptional regulator C-terminal domain-containing protein [Streptosporangiaceae bacterium]